MQMKATLSSRKRMMVVVAGLAAATFLVSVACGGGAQAPTATPQAHTEAQPTAASTQAPAPAMTIAKAEDTHTVNMTGDYFSPVVAVVHVGDTVSWVNGDSDPHSVVSFPSAPTQFDIDIDAGKTGTFTFTKPGVYQYYCDLHATYSKMMSDVKANQGTDVFPIPMRGVIVVLPKNGQLAPSGTSTVDIPDTTMTFTPWALVVPQGTTVNWTNNDEDPHAVTSVPGYATAGISTFALPGDGGTGNHAFDQPGVYYYYCPVHASWDADLQQLKPLSSYGMYPYVMDGLIVVTPK